MSMKPSQFILKRTKTKAYLKTMDFNIDKINLFLKRNKVNTKKWRPIYEVIEEAYFKESENFPDDFMQQCRDNTNEARFIPLEVKNNIKLMVPCTE